MSSSDDRKDRSRYRPIADALRTAIHDGVYAPGDRIPGENAIMAEHGVTRPTARLALDILKNEGLVVARKGSGTVVRDFRPIRSQRIQRLSREKWGAGQSIWNTDTSARSLVVDSVQVEEIEAPGHVASVLDLADNPRVVVRRRRFVLDGKPVLAATSYLPAHIAAGTQIAEPDTGPGGTYARLKDLGHEPVHFREEVRARMPMPDEVEELDMSAGTPTLLICRTAYTADQRAVEVNEMTLDSSAYILEYEFDG